MFTKELSVLEQTLLNFGGAAARSGNDDTASATRLATDALDVATRVASTAYNTAAGVASSVSNAAAKLKTDATEATSRLVEDATKASTRLVDDATKAATELASDAADAATRFAVKTATDAAADTARIVASAATEAVFDRVKTIFHPTNEREAAASPPSKWHAFHQAATVMTGPISLTLFAVEQFVKFVFYGLKALFNLASSDNESAKENFETSVFSLVNALTGLLLAVLSPVLNAAELFGQAKSDCPNPTDDMPPASEEEADSGLESPDEESHADCKV